LKALRNSSKIPVCIPKRGGYFSEPIIGFVDYFTLLSVSQITYVMMADELEGIWNEEVIAKYL
jgi:hypothetical protein